MNVVKLRELLLVAFAVGSSLACAGTTRNPPPHAPTLTEHRHETEIKREAGEADATGLYPHFLERWDELETWACSHNEGQRGEPCPDPDKD